MLILALDSSEARGSVALLRDGKVLAVRRHDSDEDYSAWLLPAVEEVFRRATARMADVDVLAAATGPGSFTGLRVGLTTVKAWAEVYRKPLVGVSRLEALGGAGPANAGPVAAYYDAQRGQIFGAFFERFSQASHKAVQEFVASPEAFLDIVDREAGPTKVCWISLDPELITRLPSWNRRLECGDTMETCAPELAIPVARIAQQHAQSGEFTDPLELDANYVRRSDAEIFWKGR